MSDEAAEESEIFDISDFTTASDWERFIVQIEEKISEWKLLASSALSSSTECSSREPYWETLSDTIQFAEVTFNITHHYLSSTLNELSSNESPDSSLPPQSMANLLSVGNDFKHAQQNTPKLAQWYDLNEFLVISPTRTSESIVSESKANILLSSACIAINNTGCKLPVFVQLHNRERQMFIGVCEGSSLKTYFNVVHFAYVPQQYNNLNGLLKIFKTKLGSELVSPLIFVSIRFTYSIQSTSLNSPSEIDLNSVSEDNDNKLVDFKTIPLGCIQDPIDAIYLCCIWPSTAEDMISESDSYSDLDPFKSNDWTLSFISKEYVELKLTLALHAFNEQSKRTISFRQIIFGNESTTTPTTQTEFKSSLKKLTNPLIAQKTSSLRNLVQPVALKMRQFNAVPIDLPLTKFDLDLLLSYLFPDVDGQMKLELNVEQPVNNEVKVLFEKMSSIKSASNDMNNLLNRLSICMLNVCQIDNGTKAIAQLWNEFLLELRCRWENSYHVYGVPIQNANPDLSQSLLYQKLQLLNFCITKKIERDKIYQQSTTFVAQSNDNDDSDEFFDALDDDASSQMDLEPDGRLKQCEDLYLINNSNIPLFIPITQEPTPMTEDVLEEHASVLLHLGVGNSASLLRARIQSASLLSDMESFKAANPGCIFEDFLRWYSPRDLIENQVDERYELSTRMRASGNVWLEAWENARAIPVRKQKKLFDDNKEAEKIFEWLNSLSIGQIVTQLLPILIHACIAQLIRDAQPLLTDLRCNHEMNLFENFSNLIETAVKLSKTIDCTSLKNDLFMKIEEIENKIGRFHVFKKKFSKANNNFLIQCVKSSFDNEHVKIKNGSNSDIGTMIVKFVEEMSHGKQDNENRLSFMNALNKPIKREYILRSSCARPAPYSRLSPQKMYSLISKNEFRLAGAFTEDTMFF